jgi:hypothetical protein
MVFSYMVGVGLSAGGYHRAHVISFVRSDVRSDRENGTCSIFSDPRMQDRTPDPTPDTFANSDCTPVDSRLSIEFKQSGIENVDAGQNYFSY